ncbi:hypothetical protein HDU96_006104 [Phlyctochytrium bullatum]|nr:hypothetical protein HDU96_006104 [Phlyctochytrium bullatum]
MAAGLAGLAGLYKVEKPQKFIVSATSPRKHGCGSDDDDDSRAKRVKRSDENEAVVVTSSSKQLAITLQLSTVSLGANHKGEDATSFGCEKEHGKGFKVYQPSSFGCAKCYAPPSPPYSRYGTFITEFEAMHRMLQVARAKRSWIENLYMEVTEHASIWMALAIAAEKKGADAITVEDALAAHGLVEARIQVIFTQLSKAGMQSFFDELKGYGLLKLEGDGSYRVHSELLKLVSEDIEVEKIISSCLGNPVNIY